MPTKKLKRDADRSKPPSPPDDAAKDQDQDQDQEQEQDQRAGKESTSGLSGRGADSVLAHLIEQEKIRGRKPERS